MAILILFFALILGYLFYNLYYKRLAYPPGPIPLPLIGNTISLGKSKRFEFQFRDWAKKYGPIYTYWIGDVPVISINDPKIAYQMFVKDGDNYVDRGNLSNFRIALGKKYLGGVIFADRELWIDQRRFTLKFLRDFGLGKNEMQNRVVEELQIIIEKINAHIDLNSEEKELNLYTFTDLAVGSLINSLVLGYRFSQDDREEEFFHLKKLSISVLRMLNDPVLIIARFNLWAKKLSYKYMYSYYRPIQELFDFLDKQIKERIKTEEINENMEPRDLVDAFLIEKAKQKRLNLPTADFYTLDQLRAVLFDLWFAGQETTSATITWAFAYVISNPQVQRKIHEELDKEINGSRLITVSDRPKLNYINATICEIQRAANIVSQNLLRKVSNDVIVEGHKIPKDSYCITQISAIHYDPEIFEEPTKFKPERFLDSNNQLIKHDALMPFSIGKRICLGESLAKMELFLILANLWNQYDFLPGKIPPELIKFPSPGSTSVKPFTCRVRRRFK